MVVDVRHEQFGAWTNANARAITSDDRGPLLGAEAAATARPSEQESPKTVDGVTRLTLPPQSWTVLSAET